MDQKTIKIYNEQSLSIADRHKEVTPLRLYSLAETFFEKGSTTLDLGCGIGRDTNWLITKGYPAVGVDASEGMLDVARTDYPKYKFSLASLPDLDGIEEGFQNVFCSAVLMHIPRADLVNSVLNILKTTKPNGRIILSYRSGQNEKDGRLFETYHPGQVAQLFESHGGKVLLIEIEGVWHNLVIEKAKNE